MKRKTTKSEFGMGAVVRRENGILYAELTMESNAYIVTVGEMPLKNSDLKKINWPRSPMCTGVKINFFGFANRAWASYSNLDDARTSMRAVVGGRVTTPTQ